MTIYPNMATVIVLSQSSSLIWLQFSAYNDHMYLYDYNIRPVTIMYINLATILVVPRRTIMYLYLPITLIFRNLATNSCLITIIYHYMAMNVVILRLSVLSYRIIFISFHN